MPRFSLGSHVEHKTKNIPIVINSRRTQFLQFLISFFILYFSEFAINQFIKCVFFYDIAIHILGLYTYRNIGILFFVFFPF